MKTIATIAATIAVIASVNAAVPVSTYVDIQNRIGKEVSSGNLQNAVQLSEICRNLRQADAAEALTVESQARMSWFRKCETVLQCLPAMIQAAQDTACPEGKTPRADNPKSREGVYQMLSALRRAYTFLNNPQQSYGVQAVKDTIDDFKALEAADEEAWKNRK